MRKFKTGNVVKSKYGIKIVTSVTDKHTHWISTNCENSSGVTPNEAYIIPQTCSRCEDDEPDEHCEICHGKVFYDRTEPGFEASHTLLAPNVQDWIKTTLLKGFEF
jgi:hypothetical protein